MTHDVSHGNSKKISDLVGTSSINDSALVTIVANGTNLKTTFGAFKVALGALGALTQIGSPTGAPVLQIDGLNFAIRNIEPGSGTIPALTALNGVKINHNFNSGAAPSASAAGVDILTDITALSPTIRSLVASTGITLSPVNGSISIGATGALPTTGVVIVNSVSDLPAAIGDSITLDAGTTYSFQGNIDLSPFRLVIDTAGIALASENRITRGFFSDNVNALITVKNTNVVPIVREMVINSPNGHVFDIQAGSGIVFNNVVNFNSAAVSKITDSVNVSFRNYTIVNVGLPVKGVTWFGACSEFNLSNGLFLDWDGTLLDFGAATFSNGLSIGPNARFDAGAGKIAIDGNAANIPTGALGQVSHNKFLGLATPLNGIDASTLGWEFLGNQGVDNTRADSLSTNTAGVGVTIVSAGVPVKIEGTWVDEGSSQFTVDGSGRATYNGLKAMSTPITASITLEPDSGTGITLGVSVAINGTVVPNSLRTAAASSGSPSSITVPWQETLQTGDFVELFASNEDTTANITVSTAVLRLN